MLPFALKFPNQISKFGLFENFQISKLTKFLIYIYRHFGALGLSVLMLSRLSSIY